MEIQQGGITEDDVVASLNGLTGDVVLAAGTNITLTPAGNIITIASTGGGGGTPGGSNTQVQFNDSGAFGGDSAFAWNKTTKILTLTGTTNSQGLKIAGNVNYTFTFTRAGIIVTSIADPTKSLTLQFNTPTGVSFQSFQDKSGTVALTSDIPVISGTTNVLPKFDGAGNFTDSRIEDDGTDITIKSPGGITTIGDLDGDSGNTKLIVDNTNSQVTLVAGNQAGMFADASTHITRVGDAIGNGNGTYISIDDMQQLIILSPLPTSDPGVVGALYQVAGAVMISL